MIKLRDEKCALTLEKMVFDKLLFAREDFSSNEKPKFTFKISAGKKTDDDIYKVTIVLLVNKDKEYNIEIALSGFFSVNTNMNIDDEHVKKLINKNAVAILMPYVRSELTLLTAQPGMESIVLPPINISAMMDKKVTER